MSAQVAADLRAAADVLRRDGWTQGRMVAPDGRCCAIGAIHKASVDGLAALAARAAFNRHLGLRTNPGEWNDNPSRTADEVIAALEAAAKRAEADQ